MEADLIAGYLAYTTTNEFGVDASGDAPASTPTIATSFVSGVSVTMTVKDNC